MIGHKDDLCLLAGVFQGLQYLADLVVDVADVREICAASADDMVFGDVKVITVIGVQNALRMGVLIGVGDRADVWHQVVAILVEVPVFLAGNIGIMRMRKTDGQTPWAGIAAARQVIKFAGRVIGDLVVIFHLIGNLGHACASDRAHIVIPPIDPFTGFAVIGGPAEIGRIDVSGQTVLEPVHLIRANKVHFS